MAWWQRCCRPFHVGIFAAGNPLSWHPPAPDFARLHGVGQIEDHYDIADVTLDLRRDIGVAAIEGEAMHAGAVALPTVDLLGRRWVADIVDPKPAAQTVCCRRLLGHDLVVDQHDPVCGLHLVRMDAVGNLDFGDDLRIGRIAYIDNRRAARRLHVADIGDAIVDGDLTAAAAVEFRNFPDAFANRHLQCSFARVAVRALSSGLRR